MVPSAISFLVALLFICRMFALPATPITLRAAYDALLPSHSTPDNHSVQLNSSELSNLADRQ